MPEKMSGTTPGSPTPTTPQKLGINITGFVKGELGIGEGVRATLRAIETTNIPFVINNIISTYHRKRTLRRSYSYLFIFKHQIHCFRGYVR